jgi:hypothetical protein
VWSSSYARNLTRDQVCTPMRWHGSQPSPLLGLSVQNGEATNGGLVTTSTRNLVPLLAANAVAGIAVAAAIALPAAHADPAPTLGVARPANLPDADGLGTARPTQFSLGSTAMSTIQHITWDSWGGPQATGHGTRQAAAMPAPERIDLVAKDLGTCGGQLVYRQIEEDASGGPGTTFGIC